MRIGGARFDGVHTTLPLFLREMIKSGSDFDESGFRKFKEGPAMEAGRLGSVEETRIRSVAGQWSDFLLREVFGNELEQMDLDKIDEASAFCGDALAQAMAEALLRHRAAALEESVCPDCGTHCDVEGNDRTLLLKRGDVAWSEPKSHCPKCDRDFFPSAGPVAGR